ncbi:MAG: alpha/beta hydrolase [Acidobacteriota bacterium]
MPIARQPSPDSRDDDTTHDSEPNDHPAPGSTDTVDQLRRLTLPSLALAGGLAAFEIARNVVQRTHLFVPSRYPTGEWDPSLHGLAFEDVYLEGLDGVTLHGWYFPRPEARGVMLYCHGNAGSIADRLGVFRALGQLGLDIFAFDYRGYGRSTGSPTEKGLYSDAETAATYLLETRGIASRSLVILGHSLGGAVAIETARRCPAAALVVESSFTDVRDMARYVSQHAYAGLPMHLIARNQFRSIAKVGELALPKLFIHGTADETVPYELGERLYAAAAEPKSWLSVPDALHNDLHEVGGERYFGTLAAFFARHVG